MGRVRYATLLSLWLRKQRRRNHCIVSVAGTLVKLTALYAAHRQCVLHLQSVHIAMSMECWKTSLQCIVECVVMTSIVMIGVSTVMHRLQRRKDNNALLGQLNRCQLYKQSKCSKLSLKSKPQEKLASTQSRRTDGTTASNVKWLLLSSFWIVAERSRSKTRSNSFRCNNLQATLTWHHYAIACTLLQLTKLQRAVQIQ